MKISRTIIAIVILISVGIWVFSNENPKKTDAMITNQDQPSSSEQDSLSSKLLADSTQSNDAEIVTKVFTPQNLITQLELTGTIEQLRSANVTPLKSAKIIDVLVKQGDRVKKGQVLVKLDKGIIPEQLEAAKAKLEYAQLDFDTQSSLNQSGYRTKLAILKTTLDLKVAIKDLENIKQLERNTYIKAPFDGYIQEMDAVVGDLSSMQKPVATLIDDSSVLVKTYTTSKYINKIKTGDKVSVKLFNGKILDGNISFISNNTTGKTRTFDIEITIPNPNKDIYIGLLASTSLLIDNPNTTQLNANITVSNTNGILGLHTINENNIVEFIPLDILKMNVDTIWVQSFPENTKVIIKGKNSVLPGYDVSGTLIREVTP